MEASIKQTSLNYLHFTTFSIVYFLLSFSRAAKPDFLAYTFFLIPRVTSFIKRDLQLWICVEPKSVLIM
jgi:hypothetical protein